MTRIISPLIMALLMTFPGHASQSNRKTPAIDVTFPARLLPKASDPCRIDFGNVRVFGENSEWTAKLKHGKYERKYKPYGHEAVTLDHVFCLDPNHAVIALNWLECGGSCTSTGVVQVIGIQANRAVVQQQFVFDSHALGTGVSFDENSRTLTITGRSDDGSPNCCAEHFDVVTYEWRADKFVQSQYRRVNAMQTGEHGNSSFR